MKLIEKRHQFKSEGIEKKEFRIKASAKAFDILSSKIYSNPILAIVRELSTNAVDAHIEADNKQSYEVTLPTSLNPYFIIRDFGTGLTQEQVEDVFTTIFESTKTDSNEVTGCLGLGSKSPFSYVDNYNVDSYIGGKLYHYTCFKDEMGVPCIAFLGEEDTDQSNGLSITVAVNIADCIKFEQAAEKIYPYLMIKPKFLGGKQLTIKKISYVDGEDYWGVMDSARPNHHDGLVVVMGGVCYPVTHKIDKSDFNDVERSLINANIDLLLNIGDVDIEAGRESLQFTKRTQNVLKHKFRNIVKYLTAKVEKDFAQCKTAWEVYCYANDYKNALGDNVINYIFQNIKIDINGKQVRPATTNIPIHYDGIFKFDLSYNAHGTIFKRKKATNIYPSNQVVIVWDDGSKASYARTRYYQECNKDKKVYFVTSQDPTLRQKIVDILGMVDTDIIDAVTMPKKPRTNAVKTAGIGPKKKTAAAVEFTFGANDLSRAWKDSNVDIHSPEYYVQIERYSPILNGKICNLSIINMTKEALNNINKQFNRTLYGFRKSLTERVQKDSNAKVINFFEYAIKEIKDFNDKENVLDKWATIQDCYGIHDYRRHIYDYLLNNITKLNPKSPMSKFLTQYKDVSINIINIPKYTKVKEFLQTICKIQPPQPKISLTTTERAVTLRYQFLNELRYSYKSMLDHIVDYVNGIDNIKGV